MNLLSASQRYWWEFLLAFTEKEIKARYKHAFLGFLWIILNPILQMLVIGFIFQFFVPVQVDNYFLFLFSGLLPWNFFSLSLTKATPSIIFERNLIQKAKFPREAIVLSIVLSNLFHFVISLILLFILLTALALFQPSAIFSLADGLVKLCLLLLALAWITLFTAALSLIFATLNVKFRDVNFMVQALIPLWFYATPIAYTLDLLPASLSSLVYLNPLTAIIELFHYVVTDYLPLQPQNWILSIIITLAMAGGGWLLFRRQSRYFDDWL